MSDVNDPGAEPGGMADAGPASTSDDQSAADNGGNAWAQSLETAEPGDVYGDDGTGPRDLGVIMDIPVRLSMEVGNTQLSIGRLLKLSRGSVVELNRAAGEPLDVLVNGTLIAHGEVVMANEKFALRLTDVVSPSERLKNV